MLTVHASAVAVSAIAADRERERERGVPLDPGSVCAAYELTYE